MTKSMIICCVLIILIAVLTVVICVLNLNNLITRLSLDVVITILVVVVAGVSVRTVLKGQDSNYKEKKSVENGYPKMPNKEEDKEEKKETITPQVKEIKIGILEENIYHDGCFQVAMQKGYFKQYLGYDLSESNFELISDFENISESEASMFIMSGYDFIKKVHENVPLKAIAVINANPKLCMASSLTFHLQDMDKSRVAFRSGTAQEEFWDIVCENIVSEFNDIEWEKIEENCNLLTLLEEEKSDIAVSDAIAVHWAIKDGLARRVTEEDICKKVDQKENGLTSMKLIVSFDDDEKQIMIEEICEALEAAYKEIEAAGGNAEYIFNLFSEKEDERAIFEEIYTENDGRLDWENFNPSLYQEEIQNRLLRTANNGDKEYTIENLIYEKEKLERK